MSRFIPEGESDLHALNKSEQEASRKFQDAGEEKESLSLYEQMRLNYIQKEQEYQDKVKARNQPYKIDEREQKFYKELQSRKEEKEEARKREVDLGLEDFERLKKQKSELPKGSSATPVVPTVTGTLKGKVPVLKKNSAPTGTKPIVKEIKAPSAPDNISNAPRLKPRPLINDYSSDSD